MESKMAVKYCGFRISFDGGEVVWCLEVGEDVLFLVAGLTTDQLSCSIRLTILFMLLVNLFITDLSFI